MRIGIRASFGASLLVVVATVARAEDTRPAMRVEECTFRAKCDSTEQKYVLVVPPQIGAGAVSVLVALHGHGSGRWQFVRQGRGECRAARDVAAAHGMVLVSPDYRARTSWMGPKAEADVLQIIQSLRKRFSVEHLILCGGSMGATAALTFTALHPELVDGVVALNGTANLVEYDRFADAIAESFGGSKNEVPNEYRKRSAEFFADRFTMPLAATTGGRDSIVPSDSVRRLLRAVKQRNTTVLGIHRPEGGHSSSYEDSKAALEFVIGHVVGSAG